MFYCNTSKSKNQEDKKAYQSIRTFGFGSLPSALLRQKSLGIETIPRLFRNACAERSGGPKDHAAYSKTMTKTKMIGATNWTKRALFLKPLRRKDRDVPIMNKVMNGKQQYTP